MFPLFGVVATGGVDEAMLITSVLVVGGDLTVVAIALGLCAALVLVVVVLAVVLVLGVLHKPAVIAYEININCDFLVLRIKKTQTENTEAFILFTMMSLPAHQGAEVMVPLPTCPLLKDKWTFPSSVWETYRRINRNISR